MRSAYHAEDITELMTELTKFDKVNTYWTPKDLRNALMGLNG